ncbi:hypothetical protein BH10BAC3_BH10BAC3_23000 [soil metagenome]
MKPAMLLYFLVIVFATTAQKNNQPPCSAPEVSQFNFWVGDWNLTWNDSLHGTNRIEKMFGNCTVHENFSDPKQNYLGQSWSVYNLNSKIWEQTWVDNQGGYIALAGGMAGDSMILKTAERTVPVKMSATGKMVNRMVFYNIKPNSFDWTWDSSTDGGLIWKPDWQIHYERKH